MGMTDITLCTLGTRGDILPFVALGRELRQRGHVVTILSNANWADMVTSHGLEFEAIAPQDPTQSGRDDYHFFIENTLPSFSRSFGIVKDRVGAKSGKQVLIYRSNMLGMECAAEVFRLPHIKVVLQPSAIRSFERPPWPLTPLATGRLRPLFRHVVIPALYGMAEFTRKYRSHTNRFRRSVGMSVPWGRPPAFGSENATLVFAPPWYAMPQKDWPQNCHCIGFPFLDTGAEDSGIAELYACRGAPLVFTPGTGVANTAAFFDKAEAVCAHLELPAIFLSRNVVPRSHAPHILTRDFVDMAWLLKRARLIIHHGGIGTTAQALRAGVPQIIVPDRFDQPDNAQRIARLGLGAAVMKDTLSPEQWANLIRELLDAPLVRQRLAKVSSDVQRNLAVSRAADVIASVLAGATSACLRETA